MGCTDTPGYNLPPCPPCPQRGVADRYGGHVGGPSAGTGGLVMALVSPGPRAALYCRHLASYPVSSLRSPQQGVGWGGGSVGPLCHGDVGIVPFPLPSLAFSKAGRTAGLRACSRTGPCASDEDGVASSRQGGEEGLLHRGGPSSLREPHHRPAAR